MKIIRISTTGLCFNVFYSNCFLVYIYCENLIYVILSLAQLVEHMTVAVFKYHVVTGSIPVAETFSFQKI